jgi:hypothetical protein
MAGGLLYGLSGSAVPVYCCAAATYLAALLLAFRIRMQAPRRPRGIASPGVVLEGLRRACARRRC